MSDGLHPHWHSEPGERPVHISVRSDAAVTPVQAPAATVSRRPAALAGIVLVCGVLLSVYGTTSLFSGQAMPPGVNTGPPQQGPTVRITDTGFEPTSISVRPGATIMWQNDSQIPHLLFSEELMTTDGALNTSPIFPGSSLAVTIVNAAAEGTYDYISQTATFSGSVIVSSMPQPSGGQQVPPSQPVGNGDVMPLPPVQSAPASAVPSPPPVQPVAAVSSSSTPPVAQAVSSAAAAPVTASSAPKMPKSAAPQNIPVIPTAAVGTIPRNPYAINRPSYVDPVTTGGSSSSVSSKAEHAGAPQITKHKPSTQPGSGPGDWAVAVMGAIAFCTLFVKACRSKAWTYAD